MGGYETNTSLKKGFELASRTRQNDLMSWLILVSEDGLILLDSFQVVYEIDRRFEESLGVGPRFILKVVTRTFWINRVSTEK